VKRLLPFLAALVLLLVACEPPAPRAKVQKPFPIDEEGPTAPSEPDGPPSREQLVAGVPATVEAIEERHQGLVVRLEEVETALTAVDAELKLAVTPEQHQRLQDRAQELRAAARLLAVEAAELRSEAAGLRETSRQLKVLSDAEQPAQ
jgi:hypothetical protein